MSRPMSRPEQSTGVISGRRVARWVAVGAAVAMTTLVGCTEVARVVPQAIVWAPGSHTFGIPSGAPDTMGPGGQVIVCTDTEAVLYFQVSEGGSLSLTSVNGGPFGGGTIGTGPEPWLNPPNFARTVDPVPAGGCGKLDYFAGAGNPAPWTGPSTATVWVTKSAPAP